MIIGTWPLTRRERAKWPANEARAEPPVGVCVRGTRRGTRNLSFRSLGAGKERRVSFPRIPTNACRLDERGDARAETSRFLRQPFAADARARARTHTHTRTHRHRDWTVNEPARRTNRRPDSPRGFSSRFSRASILLLSDWASAGDGGRGGGSRFTG